MKSLLSVFSYKPLLLSAFAWGWFEITALPKPMLVFFLFIAIILDLITGLMKSWKNGIVTSSVGFRKTVTKLLTYVAVIIGVWVLANLTNLAYHSGIDYAIIVDGTIGFLTFIELYSIFENIYELNPQSILSKRLILPILKLLKGKMKQSPFDPFIKENKDEK